MRLFVALEIPADVKTEVERRGEPLRRELPQARWVKPTSLHLTLAFLGETDPELLPVLRDHLAPAFAATAPFTLQLSGGGTFPPSRPARVAWVGIDAGPELERLAGRVTAVLVAGVGFEPDRRGFHPHLTVARCSRPWKRQEVERFVHAFRGPLSRAFEVTRGVLFRSHLGAGGARYEEVQHYPFGPGPQALQGVGP